MSTVVENTDSKSGEETPVTPQYQTEDGQPNLALLEDRMPEEFQASSAMTILVGFLGALFVLLNYFKLWHTDLWGHLSYGRLIWQNGTLPTTEPLMPLAKGVPMVNTAWASQLLGYLTMEQVGVAGIQFIYAALITFVAASLAITLYRRTQQPWIALLSVFFFYWCDYQQLLIVRPQLVGLACFTAVFVLATSYHTKKWTLFAIPAIFAIWANFHGSFIVGIALLGALTVGRAIDLFRRTRKWKAVFAETRTRHLLFVTELSAAAVLLNPYGIGIYPAVFEISSNPNLRHLIEWDPLTLRMKQGQAAAVLALTLIGLYRLSPRRVTAGEVLVLTGLGLGALWTSRLIVWWAPVAAYYFGLHASAVWRTWMHARPKTPKRGGLYTVSILGMLWIFFAYTPLGNQLLHSKEQTPEEAELQTRKALAARTPLEAVDYFKKNPPQGLVFNSYEWGDYLLWSHPDEIKVFVASHVHLVPEEVWGHYLEISQAGPTWDSKLNRYGVNTVVLNPQLHGGLAQRLEDETETWSKAFESNKTVIFERKQKI